MADFNIRQLGFEVERLWRVIEISEFTLRREDRFVIESPGGLVTAFIGTNLTYGPNGAPISGTITRISVFAESGITGRPVVVLGFDVDPLAAPLTAVKVGDAVRGLMLGDTTGYDSLFIGRTQSIDGGPASERIEPANGFQNQTADSMAGGGGNDTILGGGGNDKIQGGAGNDVVENDAGDGRDTMNGGSDSPPGGGASALAAESDIDTLVFFGFSPDSVTVDLRIVGPQNTGSFGIDTYLNFENVIGTAGADTIIGNQFANRLESGVGQADLLDGQGGNDTLVAGSNGPMTMNGGAGKDTISGLSGGDLITGDNGNDLLGGGLSSDTMLGGAGFDRIFGGQGNDRINSGAGRDGIATGPGSDIVSFTSRAWGGDTIGDFEDGVDKLRFKLSIADSIADFAIAGNGTASVTLSIGLQSLIVKAPGPVTLTNADLEFVA